MAVYLDEQLIGIDCDVIGFPHLLICLGFVVMCEDAAGARNLSGVHLTDIPASKRAFPQFLKSFTANRPAGAIKAIYGCCNWNVRYPTGDQKSAWGAEMKDYAGQLGFNGPARGFNTGIITPRDGTYVQYDLNPQPKTPVRIYYRQNDKMVFKGGGPAMRAVMFGDATRTVPASITDPETIAKISAKFQDRVETTDGSKSSASVKQSWKPGTKKLREVDYSLRMEETWV